jgi:hypothetical protein
MNEIFELLGASQPQSKVSVGVPRSTRELLDLLESEWKLLYNDGTPLEQKSAGFLAPSLEERIYRVQGEGAECQAKESFEQEQKSLIVCNSHFHGVNRD